MKLATLLLALTSIVAACASTQPTDSPGASPVVLALPAIPDAGPGAISACAGVGLSTVLAGDPADPRIAWLEPFGGGTDSTFGLLWPPGYAARFDPDLEVTDEGGRVVLRAGDFVDGACVVRQDRFLGLVPPFVSLRLICGPMLAIDCTEKVYQAATAAGWPDRDIAELRFVDQQGHFTVTYEDGSKGTGLASDR